MNKRIIFIPVFILITIMILSCSQSGILYKTFVSQEWSENYALLEGVKCTSSLMVDGKRDTIGKTGHEIIIELPERKPIHKIVIRDTNIEDLILYRGAGNKWMKVTKIVNNIYDTIDIRVKVATDKIRFRIGGTFDDERVARKLSPVTGKIVGSTIKRSAPVVSEIELYGFVTKSVEKQEPEEEEMLF